MSDLFGFSASSVLFHDSALICCFFNVLFICFFVSSNVKRILGLNSTDWHGFPFNLINKICAYTFKNAQMQICMILVQTVISFVRVGLVFVLVVPMDIWVLKQSHSVSFSVSTHSLGTPVPASWDAGIISMWLSHVTQVFCLIALFCF